MNIIKYLKFVGVDKGKVFTPIIVGYAYIVFLPVLTGNADKGFAPI